VSSLGRVGILGGTFDPVHTVHLDIANAAIAQCALDRVLFVVAARPPHKRGATFAAPEARYAMVAAALSGADRLEPSRIELDRSGPSYTVETLRALRARYPAGDLCLILGMDSLIDLPGWREPDEILRLARLLVVPRPGDAAIPRELVGRFEMLRFPAADLSSTEIRRRVAAGEAIDGLVPDCVRRFIFDRGLYGARPASAPR
jgi:nicotinate-nucleotide adenylyltransferase